MKINKSVAICAAVLGLALASDSFAGSSNGSKSFKSNNGHHSSHHNDRNSRNYHDRRGGKKGGKNPTAVPELNAAGAPIAFALIAGIAGVAMERRRKKA